MDIVFVRHGQPAWSVDGLSDPDPQLTELGRAQAERTAKRLASEPRDVVELLVSPAVRSQQTAQPIAEATNTSIETIDNLVEIKMPDWRGELEETVQRIFKNARHRPAEDWWEGLPGGESFRDFHDRIIDAMRDLLGARGIRPDEDGRPHMWHADGDDRRIVIVAHGGTNAVAIGYLLGVDPTPWEWERFLLGHASIARAKAIPLAGGFVFSLRSFNDMEHLSHDMRTK